MDRSMTAAKIAMNARGADTGENVEHRPRCGCAVVGLIGCQRRIGDLDRQAAAGAESMRGWHQASPLKRTHIRVLSLIAPFAAAVNREETG